MKKIIHVDLTKDAANALIDLEKKLDEKIPLQEMDTTIDLAREDIQAKKLKGKIGDYIVSTMDPMHESTKSIDIADELARRIKGVELLGSGSYNIDGKIVNCDENGKIDGHDVLHYIASHAKQDIAVALNKGNSLHYIFDCSMYEKTPKDPITGVNNYLGQDLLEFHGKAKTHGHIMPSILNKLVEKLDDGSLDMLVIDLKGANTYSNGRMEVRRHERDYVTSLGNGMGILAYADVDFQPTNEDRPPYGCGDVIDLTNFHGRYKLKENG